MNHIEQGIADAFTEIAKNTSAIDKKQNITSYKTIMENLSQVPAI